MNTAPPADPAQPPEAPAPKRPGARRHLRWASYAWGAVVLVSLGVAVPLALGSIGKQLFAPDDRTVYTFSPGRAAGSAASPAGDASFMNISVVGLDEAKKVLTLRLSGHRACTAECPAFTLRLFSLSDSVGQRAGLPPSAAVNVAAGTQVVSESVDLPISGIPSLYPFDRYMLLLASTLTPADDAAATAPTLPLYTGTLTVTLESDLPRFLMLPPENLPATDFPIPDAQVMFQRVTALRFIRPVHLQVLTCLLVSLIAAAALLSVCTEPVRRLLVGVGSVVLSVWGVRQILIADAPPAITTVDLLLSGVILILLYGIAIRILLILRRDGWDSLVRLIRDG